MMNKRQINYFSLNLHNFEEYLFKLKIVEY